MAAPSPLVTTQRRAAGPTPLRGSVLSSAPARRTVVSCGGSAARAAEAVARRERRATARTGKRRMPGKLRLERSLCLSGGAYALDHLVEVIADDEQVEVLRGDHALAEGALAQPVDQPVPVGRVDQADRELVDLAGLDQRQRLEELVERAEAAGQDDERVRVADEHDLAREEVVELERVGDVAVGVLLEGQLDVQADRARAGLARAAVGGLHGAGPAPGDDGEAGLAEPPADPAGELVLPRARRRARRAEDRDAAMDPVQRAEAHLDLGRHARDALFVGDEAQDRRHLGAEDLLVVGEWAVGGVLRHRTVSLPESSGGLRPTTCAPRTRRRTARPRLSVVTCRAPSVSLAPGSEWSRPR